MPVFKTGKAHLDLIEMPIDFIKALIHKVESMVHLMAQGIEAIVHGRDDGLERLGERGDSFFEDPKFLDDVFVAHAFHPISIARAYDRFVSWM